MAIPTEIRDKTAICGVGMTKMGRHSESALSLAVEVFKLALEDSGLKKDEVDGLFVLDIGSDYDRVLEATGVEVVYANQGWQHGRFISSMMIEAAMVVHHGLANCVAIVHGQGPRLFGTPEDDSEMWRQGLGPHGESPAYGAVSPAYGAAMAARRYFHMYGGGNENLAPIAVSLRNNARLNPGALRRDPMTIEDHQKSRWVVEPLRLFDCCQTPSGGVCFLITSAERARNCKKPPVYIMGMQGVHAGREYFNLAQPGLGVSQQSVFRYEPDDLRAYEMAGITQKDIDAVAIYDSFSPMVLFALERWGFCGPGEAMDFVKDGRIEVGGELPVNTSGGLLSEGHIVGWNLFVELIRQLRGECGDRQVKDAEIMQYASTHAESIIFRR